MKPLQALAILSTLLVLSVQSKTIPTTTQNELTSTHIAPLSAIPPNPNPTQEHRRQFIIEMTREAWNSVGKSSRGDLKQIVAGMSTLWLMNLKEEFTRGKEVIEVEQKLFGKNSVSEKLKDEGMGALLSAYALSGDESLLGKAREIAEVYRVPELQKNNLLSVINSYITHKMESRYLSDMTGDSDFVNQVSEVEKFLGRLAELEGIHESDSINLNVELKSYLQSNRHNNGPLLKYLQTIKVLETTGYLHTSPKFPLTQIREYSHVGSMNIWHCLFGSMLALGAKTMPEAVNNPLEAKRHLELARQITETCHMATNTTKSGLPYSMFGIDETAADSREAVKGWGGYSLEPALAESYFVLYRLTGDPIYREYAWELAQSIYKYSRVNKNEGYTNTLDSDQVPPVKNNPLVQPPEFLSGTLKYLYLTFAPESFLPLDEWVFTVMGHPLPICGKNAAYPKGKCA